MTRGEKIIAVTGALLFLFMLASLLILSDAMRNSTRFGDLYAPLLIFNAIGLLVLVVLIGLNLRSLLLQLRRRTPGVRMTIRMVSTFAALSVIPVLIVYLFSLDFLHRGIDNWFDLRVEKALDDALELSRLSLEQRMKEILKQSKQIADALSEFTNAAIPFEIDDLRLRSGAEELTVMSRQGNFIAWSGGDTVNLVPPRPEERILLQLQQGSNYVGLDAVGSSGLSIRAVINIPHTGIEPEPRIIQLLFPFSERVSALAQNVEDAFVKYQELSYLREQLKFSFLLVLTLVLLFTVLSALWAAFYSARRLVSPIRDLAEGTRAVAAGDYSTQLPVPGRDELGFLVASFNEMTRRIETARDEVSRSQQQAEAQRTYLESVLRRLSSGVMVLGHDQRIQTANDATGQILAIDLSELVDHSLREIRQACPSLDPLLDVLWKHFSDPRGDWREQVTLFGASGRQILMCSGAFLSLPGGGESPVQVIVVDDITALIHAQKTAAWSEMARRLAHEIKNPLTPIQLAAERLRQKYLHNMAAGQAEALNRLTTTIIQQVETMKHMVNTFSEYARVPAMRLEPVNLNELVQEVVDLYSTLENDARIIVDLEPSLPITMVDPGRIRQVLNNLINNAFEASSGNSLVQMGITTSHVSETGRDYIEIRIRDSGTGVSGDIIGSIFEPYVTTKQKGTGLGLAIVKKIIDEHNGLVWMENNRDAPGACAVIRLPVSNVAANDINDRVQQRNAV